MNEEYRTPVPDEEIAAPCPEEMTAGAAMPEEMPSREEAAEPEDKKAKKTAKRDTKKLASDLEAVTEERDRTAAKLAEAREAHLRTLAEYENYRKRTAKERDEIYPNAIANAVTQFLPAMDAFERGMATACADEAFAKGMQMVKTQMEGALAKLGCESFGEPGEPFDPTFHNAVMHVEDEEHEEPTVVEVFQRGYKIGDKIVRFAMVKVAN